MIDSKLKSITQTKSASMMEAINTITALFVSSVRVGHDTF